MLRHSVSENYASQELFLPNETVSRVTVDVDRDCLCELRGVVEETIEQSLWSLSVVRAEDEERVERGSCNTTNTITEQHSDRWN
jgi:hypothetical protein